MLPYMAASASTRLPLNVSPAVSGHYHITPVPMRAVRLETPARIEPARRAFCASPRRTRLHCNGFFNRPEVVDAVATAAQLLDLHLTDADDEVIGPAFVVACPERVMRGALLVVDRLAQDELDPALSISPSGSCPEGVTPPQRPAVKLWRVPQPDCAR